MVKWIETIAVKITPFLIDPFGWWIKSNNPYEARGNERSVSHLAMILNNREELVKFATNSALESTHAANEGVSQRRNLYLNFFIASGAFLGTLIGIIGVQGEFNNLFLIPTYLLLISFIVGVFVVNFEWSMENKRAGQRKINAEIASIYFMQSRDAEAIKLLNQTIDDHMPFFWVYFWVLTIRTLAFLCAIFAIISLCIITTFFNEKLEKAINVSEIHIELNN